MKNKKSVKLLSTLLAAILIAVPCMSVFAFAAETKSARTCPVINIHGFMASDIVANAGTDEEKLIYPMSTDEILNIVNDCVPALTQFLVTKDWDTLGNTLSSIVCGHLEGLMLDNNGDPVNNSGTPFEYPAPTSIKKNSEVSFKYDWRVDPIVSAQQLNDFINYVLECSGAEKVALNCHSLGGVIVSTYLTLYGNEKIHGVILNSTAIYGESYIGEMFKGNFTLTKEATVEYLRYCFDQIEYEDLMNGIIDTLTSAGIFSLLLPLADELLANLSDTLLPGFIVPLFGGWLTVWAMVPDEDIDAAMDYVFNTVYANSDVDRSGLIEKIENYNELVRPYKTQVLEELDEAGCRIGVFSRYGYCAVMTTPAWQNLGDGSVDTKSSSFGATTALYGETLSDDYLANVDSEYVSPDKSIDASTSMFADRTWFIKYLKHSDDEKNLEDLFNEILFAQEVVTVDTFEEYPRYLINDTQQDIIRPETETDADTQIYAPNLFIRVVTAFLDAINFVLDFLRNLFSF